MTSPDGNKFRTLAEKAVNMKSPCLQITPVFPNKLDEWAKLLYYFINMAKQIQDKIGLPFLIDLAETGGGNPQCKGSANGLHEMYKMPMGTESISLTCIHCGFTTLLTIKEEKEIETFFKQKLFIEPRPFDDGSNH